MKSQAMMLLMERVESAVKTQLSSEMWRRKLLGGLPMPALDSVPAIQPKLLNELARDIAANAVASLEDVCPLCLEPMDVEPNEHDVMVARQKLLDTAFGYRASGRVQDVLEAARDAVAAEHGLHRCKG